MLDFVVVENLMEPVETGWKRIDNWSKTGFSILGAFPHTNIFSLIKNIQKIQGGRVKMFFLVKIFWEVASTKGRAKWLQIYGLVLLEEDLSMTISINFLCIRNLWFVYYLLVTAADFYYSLHVKEKNYCCKLHCAPYLQRRTEVQINHSGVANCTRDEKSGD